MKALTFQSKSSHTIINEIEQSISVDFQPSLAIIFISIEQDRKPLLNFLNSKDIQIFGCTTSGEFINSDIESGSIATMLLDLKKDYFKISYSETGQLTTYENSKILGAIGKKTFTKPAFIILSGWLSQDGEDIIKGVTDGYGNEVTIYGGMAGDDLKLEGPIVFTNAQNSEKGLLGLIIDTDKIELNGIATCGWKAIGIPKTITKSEGNIVYTIDDQPALDTIMKYLGVEIDLDGNKEIVTQIGSYYPLQMEREGVAPVMRTAMFANKEDRSLICAGNVPQGSKVKFSLPPDFDAIDIVIEECKNLKNESQVGADALLMFSCISRHLSLGILMHEELEQVQNVWKAPMAGFFSYGEFGKSKTGKHEFHNNTCCVVALKETYI